LKEQHDTEIKNFNDRWEYTLFKLSETSKKIEDDLHTQHETEMQMLEEEIENMGQPPVKFSSGLLNKKYKLKFLVKAKKYSQAKELQEDIKQQEKAETEIASENFLRSIDKLRENKQKKHVSEYEAVKARLEKSINSKLKQRMTEYEQLLLRIQNCHNDMMNKQSVEFGKIQSIHSKLLAKYSLNIDDIANRYEHIEEEDPQMIHEEDEYEDPRESKEQYVQMQKGNFSKHLESSSQGEMKIVEENFEEESSLTNGRQFNKSGKKLLQEPDNEEMKTQGQINGYWKNDHIEDFAENEMSGGTGTNNINETLEQTNGFNNFQKIESNQGSKSSSNKGSSRNSKSNRSSHSRSSSSSSSSGGSSSSSSSSESDSD
jgi:uncharacterized membrane protein YgcG